MSTSMDYDLLKEEAKYRGQAVTDLIALSAGNDPFYSGKPGDVKLARWFTGLWRRFGYRTGVHIRRMHYQIISQDNPPVILPDGTPYENTERCWDVLNAAAKHARYLRMVDAEAFVDRRNPPATLYMAELPGDPYVGTRDNIDADWAALPGFPEPPTYGIANYNAQGRQRYLVEIVAEKSTMNDVLLPFCEQYGFNLVTGLGELSITAALATVRRIFALGKPARIFYVSDFDPAGASMPVAFARKLEYFMRLAQDEYPESDVRLDPVVLTAAQVRRYGLPRTPIKESEKRAHAFELRFGEGAVELDALEALRPGELVTILRRAIAPYYDQGLDHRIADARQEFSNALLDVRNALLWEHADAIAALRDRYVEAKAAAEAILGPVLADLHTEWNALEQALADRALDPDDFPIPEPGWADEEDDQLYASGRDYFSQLDYYKTHQGKSA